MKIKRITPAFALPLALCLAAPAMAEPDCSGGGYAADALVVPAPEIGDIETSTQYAWDGGGRLVEVCNLLTEGADFFATWSLFSGEIDAVYPGICVSLTNTQGVEWFSCAAADVVAAAFAAAPQTEAGIIRFEAWEPQAPTLQ
ncbi:hypothetical protein KUL25_19670 [Rhodobacteraceae bacterium N5(2021)]|uniref:Avidin family protein n=1 Tax=Gymnodinialimonas phycosphaerae TaxID=2841589 RepID=A0A975TUP1_9RHOB|nr:hypothetical protein [Gymnodinialimonas phycosphaerae]MBY4894983.1 hypothetical protein [Gymnodinialimonas phycosphaerae]